MIRNKRIQDKRIQLEEDSRGKVIQDKRIQGGKWIQEARKFKRYEDS